MRLIAMLLAAIMLLAFGCTGNGAADAYSNGASGNAAGANQYASIQNNSAAGSAASGVGVDMANAGAKNPIVVFETTKGTFKAEIYEKDAPITAGNFLSLVKSGFYNNLTFHRVVPDFVIQGGDPKGDGTGGSDKEIPLEVKATLKHVYGTLSMARAQDPNSASSQFFVVKGPASFLDMQYAVFGRVNDAEGMKVVEKIVVGDRMTKVYVQQ